MSVSRKKRGLGQLPPTPIDRIGMVSSVLTRKWINTHFRKRTKPVVVQSIPRSPQTAQMCPPHPGKAGPRLFRSKVEPLPSSVFTVGLTGELPLQRRFLDTRLRSRKLSLSRQALPSRITRSVKGRLGLLGGESNCHLSVFFATRGEMKTWESWDQFCIASPAGGILAAFTP